MTQRQIIGAVVGCVLVVLACVFVFRQFSSVSGPAGETMRAGTTATQKAPTTKDTAQNQAAAPAPAPDTIDGVAGSIESQSSTDTSALDEEESGSLDQINQDSDSVNNFGTSYDENNL